MEKKKEYISAEQKEEMIDYMNKLTFFHIFYCKEQYIKDKIEGKMKLKTINNLISYFEGKEEFEYCSELIKLKDEIMSNDPNLVKA